MHIYKALTDPGRKRKFNRLIVEQLEKLHPDIYAQLAKRANKTIKKDNDNELSLVQDAGLYGTPHHASPELIRAKQAQIAALKKLTGDE
jgi:hypothetical protein